jgi:eukaryotic-like serine/threonine-protein kinase
VSRSSWATRGAFWRADWFVALLVIVAVLLLSVATEAITTIERRFYDFGITSGARQPSDRIAVIAIDDLSVANIGRWPWPRDIHAQLIDKLAAAKAKTIVYTTLFFEPQTDPGLVFIRKIKEALAAAGDGQAGADPQVAQLIEQAERTLDTDRVLAASIKAAGNVLLPSVYKIGEPQGKPDQPLPPSVARDAISENTGFSVNAISGQHPLAMLAEAAAGVGHLDQIPDIDGAVRDDPLLVNYYGKAVPSMALLAAARSLNLGPADIRLVPGEAVQLGRLRIGADESARMLSQFYKPHDGRAAFVADSFYDVLSGKIPATKYTDKIVLVGATAAGVGTLFAVPGYAGVSPAEMIAHITSSILREHFIVRPSWAVWAELGALLAIAAYLLALLPRLSAGMGAALTGTLLGALALSEFGLLAGASMWLQFMLPAVLLVVGHLALTTKHYLVTEAGKLKSDDESAETNRMMGLALQGQGQFDMSFDRFRRVPMSDAVMENLYNLALDFERKRQFNKAQAVYEHMAAWRKDFKDLPAKLNRARNLSETVILGGGGSHPGGTILLEGGAVEKPMLGRYQLEKELGKGAMGVVYLGKDPKIGRVVAIKTMALSQEFSGDELIDARERFFREAETAGRLQHQNIVTIFDAGEEHDLAYIAMEFLKGQDLADYCKPPQLLPVAKVVNIVAQVADALGYAHRQHVVHRDIKPANIMYEPASEVVKVTDFGIARITDSSKTKTGLVLGTPSYMSPEQIAGKKVDGRSDLYSLGVMLFQMLTGLLPFRGDSMAELMYKIGNEEAPDVRVLRAELPERLATVVALALCKQPEGRYQTGEQFAAALRSVLAALPERAAAVTGAGQFDRTLIGRPGAVPAPPGYDPGAQAADDEGERAARTVAFNTPAVPGTVATPHEQSDGSAQTGKP